MSHDDELQFLNTVYFRRFSLQGFLHWQYKIVQNAVIYTEVAKKIQNKKYNFCKLSYSTQITYYKFTKNKH